MLIPIVLPVPCESKIWNFIFNFYVTLMPIPNHGIHGFFLSGNSMTTSLWLVGS